MRKLIVILSFVFLVACSNSNNKRNDWYIAKWIIAQDKTLELGDDLPESHFNVLKMSVGMSSKIIYEISADTVKLYKGPDELKRITVESTEFADNEVTLETGGDNRDIVIGYDKNGEYLKMDGWAGGNEDREDFELKLYIEKVD